MLIEKENEAANIKLTDKENFQKQLKLLKCMK